MRNSYPVRDIFWHVALAMVALFGQLHLDSDLAQFPLLSNAAMANETTLTPIAKAECLDLVSSELSTHGRRLLDLISLKLNTTVSSEDVQNFANVILNSDEVINPFSSDGSIADAQLAGATDLFLANITDQEWSQLRPILRSILGDTSKLMDSIKETDNQTSKVGINPLKMKYLNDFTIGIEKPQFIRTPRNEVFYIVYGIKNTSTNRLQEPINLIFQYDFSTQNLNEISEAKEPDTATDPSTFQRLPHYLAVDEVTDDSYKALAIYYNQGSHLVQVDLLSGEISKLHTYSQEITQNPHRPQFVHISKTEVYLHMGYKDDDGKYKSTVSKINPRTGEIEIIDLNEFYGPRIGSKDGDGNVQWISQDKKKNIFQISTLKNGQLTPELINLIFPTLKPENKTSTPYFVKSGYWITTDYDINKERLSFYRIDPKTQKISELNSIKFVPPIPDTLSITYYERDDGTLYVGLLHSFNRIALLNYNKTNEKFEIIDEFEIDIDTRSQSIGPIRFFEDSLNRLLLVVASSDGNHRIFDILEGHEHPYFLTTNAQSINMRFINTVFLSEDGDVLIFGTSHPRKIIGRVHVKF